VQPIFAAVPDPDPGVLAALLTSSPELACAESTASVLVEAIPHWLYAGDTPLHLAAAALRPRAATLLLERGALVNAVNRRGARPVHYACDPRPNSGGSRHQRAQAELIQLLADWGAELDQADRGGATPLHRAVRARSPAAVRQLLRLGARVDGRLRTRGSTPLHLATQSTGASGTAGARDAQLEIIGLLLAHGGDLSAVDAHGRSPRDWATSAAVRAALG
jgi:ankyrin repeat protein